MKTSKPCAWRSWRLVVRLRSLASDAAVFIGVMLIAWFMVANVVFAFRHPWATQTERLIHIADAVLFRKVPYSEMRGR